MFRAMREQRMTISEIARGTKTSRKTVRNTSQLMFSLYFLDTYKREYIEIRRYKGECSDMDGYALFRLCQVHLI